MATITKRAFEKGMAELESMLAENKKKQAEIESDIEINGKTVTEDLCDYMNGLYDQAYYLEQEIRALETDYRRRNWTRYDYSQYELISQNID